MNQDPLLKTTYRERVLAFCERNHIVVPPAFNSRECHKFAIIDRSETPNKLCALTTYLPWNVTEIIEQLDQEKGPQEWLVLDVKRCAIVKIEGKKAIKLEDVDLVRYRPSPLGS